MGVRYLKWRDSASKGFAATTSGVIIRVMPTRDKADLSRIAGVPGQRSGQPCVRGLRVTVWDVLDMLAAGMTEDEILEDYPYLERADFPPVYAYAAQAGRERVSS